jgi:hypothetical protein
MLVPNHKTARRVFQCVGVGIGAYLIVLLVIPLLGPGWHLLHGDFISYGGWRIPVPKGFYVGKSQMGPTMWKHTLGIPLFNVPYGHISLYSRPDQQPFAYDRDYSRFEKGVTQEASQSGYQLKSKRMISVGKNSGHCLEFTRLSGEPRSLVRCVVENSVVVLFYEGDPRYISDVFAALQGMSLESAKSGSLYQYDGEPGLTWTYDASRLYLRRLFPAYLLRHDFAV